MRIVGIMMVHNEETYIERVFRNVIDFCDELIVADNHSTDRTYEIVEKISADKSHVHLLKIDDHGDSQWLVGKYANSPTWVMAIDGDEIYDPAGLMRFKKLLKEGEFDGVWSIQSNVLHCKELNIANNVARGYLTPPARSVTKLYNFSLIESWTGKTERLHEGKLVFLPGVDPATLKLYNKISWENSDLRCLHTCFIPRSSSDKTANRINPPELRTRKFKGLNGWLMRVMEHLGVFRPDNQTSTWKLEKYARGELVEKDISSFFV